MIAAGWVGAVVAAIGGFVYVASYLTDQVTLLAGKMSEAIRAVRAVREELRKADLS